jgi:hypothetical protein
MKLKSLLFLTIFSVTIFSCKKEDVEPDYSNVTIETNDDTTKVVGKSWELVNGRLYVENLDNGDLTYYDHFGVGQTKSNLNPFNTSSEIFDNIELGTTWEFGSNGFSIDDELQYSYEIAGTAIPDEYIYKVYVNGSVRPMEVIYKQGGVISFRVYEGYTSYNNSNIGYYSVLTFIQKGEFCNNCVPDSKYGYTYMGTIENQTTPTYTLDGTRWVITRVLSGLANDYPNDTLEFGTNTYTWIPGGAGNSVTESYTLNQIVGNNMADLTLYNIPSLGGDYSGNVPENFIQSGVVDGVDFSDIFNTNSTKKVWMEQL